MEITNTFQVKCKDKSLIDKFSAILVKENFKNFTITGYDILYGRNSENGPVWVYSFKCLTDYKAARMLIYDFCKKTTGIELTHNIKVELPDYYTIKDLKELIKELPDDLPIGSVGHFGEFLPMSKYDFTISKTNPNKKGQTGWRNVIQDQISIFDINSPDKGESPY